MAMGKGKKVVLWIIGSIVALLLLALVVLNVYVRVTYGSYYAQAQREFDIPGINAGFICQDLDYYDENDCWLFSGYSSGDGPSPLYRLENDGRATRFYASMPDGSPYTDHGSAITTNNQYAYLACEDGYLVFDARELASASADEVVRSIAKVDLEFTPAFMNIENDTLYAGTFHLIPSYPAPPEHHMIAADGSENAGIVCVFPADLSSRFGFAAIPQRVYSIPDAAQGICVFANGDIMLSSSYGISSSHLRTYSPSQDQSSETFLVSGQEVPLYFLDSSNLISDIVAPPMSEGIETHEGRVYVSEESASNKYIFGKLYGAGCVYSIAIP